MPSWFGTPIAISIGVTHAPPQFSVRRIAWAGLALDGPRVVADTVRIREVLGNDAVIVIANDGQSPVSVIRQLVKTGARALLVLADANQTAVLSPILKAACSLATFRHIVLLHDGSEPHPGWIGSSAILMLRDEPGMSETIEAITAHKQSSKTNRVRKVSPLAARRARLIDSAPLLSRTHPCSDSPCLDSHE
ncbi:MAG: hypothetical protein JNK53_00860 [Phycisphaerae bacterium]|nr:hypothetical protein [Phycisphaerae bacterium]